MRPLLLLDFDGPLNPYRAQEIPPGFERHEIVEGDKTWVVLLNQQHSVELNALAEVFDLVLDPRTGLTAADFAAIRNWAGRNSFADKAFRPHD
ncbi:hypothetical protein ACGFIF_25585 [Kribbella sp. NPDC049174]|uniref:hypothetical protein n=1 Tax=Kribbella sp. NPDC049174 TaxID=3364112 RepID=UPI003723133B